MRLKSLLSVRFRSRFAIPKTQHSTAPRRCSHQQSSSSPFSRSPSGPGQTVPVGQKLFSNVLSAACRERTDIATILTTRYSHSLDLRVARIFGLYRIYPSTTSSHLSATSFPAFRAILPPEHEGWSALELSPGSRKQPRWRCISCHSSLSSEGATELTLPAFSLGNTKKPAPIRRAPTAGCMGRTSGAPSRRDARPATIPASTAFSLKGRRQLWGFKHDRDGLFQARLQPSLKMELDWRLGM